MLATGHWNDETGSVRIWDLATVDGPTLIAADPENVLALAFSPDGRALASAGIDGSVRLWEVKSGTEFRRLYGHRFHVKDLAFSESGDILATAGAEGLIKLWWVKREPRDGGE